MMGAGVRTDYQKYKNYEQERNIAYIDARRKTATIPIFAGIVAAF